MIFVVPLPLPLYDARTIERVGNQWIPRFGLMGFLKRFRRYPEMQFTRSFQLESVNPEKVRCHPEALTSRFSVLRKCDHLGQRNCD